MVLEKLRDIAFPAAFQGKADRFIDHIKDKQTETDVDRILIESGSIILNGNEYLAVCATAYAQNQDGDPRIMEITALLIREE